MNAVDGIEPIADYTGDTTMDQIFDKLIALIPNPDAAHGTGAVSGGGMLDEMSPAAAAQLRVELTAAKTKANNTTIV